MDERIAVFGSLVVLLMILPAFGQAACVAPPSGLVSWWSGDGNNADDVKGTNPGVSHGATFVSGMVGSAFGFNGVDSFVQVNDSSSLDITDALTIEAWINVNAYDPIEGEAIVAKMGGRTAERSYIMFIGSNGKIYFGTVSSPGTGGTWVAGQVIPLSKWVHVAGVKDSGSTSARIYVNGALAASGTVEHPIYSGAASIGIGTFVQGFDAYPTEGFFDGLIDEVSIYNRALTASEIQSIFNAGSDGKCKPTATSIPTATPGLTSIATETPSATPTSNLDEDRRIRELEEQVKRLKEEQAMQARKMSWLESILNSLRAFFKPIFGWKDIPTATTPTATPTQTSTATASPTRTPYATRTPTLAPTLMPIPTPSATTETSEVVFSDDFSGGFLGENWVPVQNTPQVEPNFGNSAPSLKFAGVPWPTPVPVSTATIDGPAPKPAGSKTTTISSATNPFNTESGFTVSADIAVTPGLGSFTFTIKDQNNPLYNLAGVGISPYANGIIRYTISSLTGRKDALPLGVSNPFSVDTKFHTFSFTVDGKGNAKWRRDGVIQTSRTGFPAGDYVIEFRAVANPNRPYWDISGLTSQGTTGSTYDTGGQQLSLTAQDFYIDNVKVTTP